jgi:hypothetical protein
MSTDRNVDVEKTPVVIAMTGAPEPVITPRRTPVPLKAPPPGRPPGSLSISELVDRVAREVNENARVELVRANRELRRALAAQIRLATTLGLAALGLNALAFVAALARPGRGWIAGLGLAAVTVFFVGFASTGVRLARRRTAALLAHPLRAEARGDVSGVRAAWSGSHA